MRVKGLPGHAQQSIHNFALALLKNLSIGGEISVWKSREIQLNYESGKKKEKDCILA